MIAMPDYLVRAHCESRLAEARDLRTSRQVARVRRSTRKAEREAQRAARATLR